MTSLDKKYSALYNLKRGEYKIFLQLYKTTKNEYKILTIWEEFIQLRKLPCLQLPKSVSFN